MAESRGYFYGSPGESFVGIIYIFGNFTCSGVPGNDTRTWTLYSKKNASPSTTFNSSDLRPDSSTAFVFSNNGKYFKYDVVLIKDWLLK